MGESQKFKKVKSDFMKIDANYNFKSLQFKCWVVYIVMDAISNIIFPP